MADELKPGKTTLALSKAQADKEAAEARERAARAAELAELKRQRDEAAEERKQAKADEIETLKKQLEDEKKENQEKDKRLSSLTRWFLTITVTGALLLLLFIGSMIGVVQSGDINIPLIGNVKVGAEASEAATEEAVEQPGQEPTE
jgi:Fe2+ transport system protein B